MTTTAEWPAGYRINPRVNTLDPSLVEAFRQVPVAVAGDCLGRCIGARGLRAYHGDPSLKLCGPAFTVRVRPGDNLMVHKALMMVQPGDILVVDGGGDTSQAVIGGLVRTTALRVQLGGIVIDGAVRDLEELAEGIVPIFAAGHTHRGPSKEGPGEINVPIACAGLAVLPGDLVLGDADGVLAVRAEEVAALLPRTQAHLAREASIRKTNEAGTADPERFDALLRAKGLPL
ncbi:RraA family protein [Pseudomonas oryzihabitans]|uniref:Putative 4-hydroxy-4-methyl-2-oxoglutarate aldolase n=1 Tax=Pseudomonas oryzihabitans TaxID=47885 RepID=A0A2Z5AC80_9PSED|nr:RraA family protein [Pseudomonas oryzihabitans]AXA67719.1 methyltransferase [Pseudomonas oryzihabitans]